MSSPEESSRLTLPSSPLSASSFEVGSELRSSQSIDSDSAEARLLANAPSIVDDKRRYVKTDEVINVGHRRTVYRAYDDEEGRDVAWIEYSDVPDSVAVAVEENFGRLYQLESPYIVKYLSAWVDTEGDVNSAVFITELPPSHMTLKQYSSNVMRFPIKIIKRWCRQIASGLHFLASHNFYHRDLKCSNIYIDSNTGKVIIATLELTLFIDTTHPANFDGTPGFLDPEIGPNSDRDKEVVYSFGCCVLEMITSKYPFGAYTSAMEIFRAAMDYTIPPELEEVEDEEAADFIRMCLRPQKERPSMNRALQHPFLGDENTGDGVNNRGASMHGRQIVLQLKRSPSQDSTSSGRSSRTMGGFDGEDSDEDLAEYQSKRARQVVLVDPSMVGMDMNGDFGLEIAASPEEANTTRKVVDLLTGAASGDASRDGGGATVTTIPHDELTKVELYHTEDGHLAISTVPHGTSNPTMGGDQGSCDETAVDSQGALAMAQGDSQHRKRRVGSAMSATSSVGSVTSTGSEVYTPFEGGPASPRRGGSRGSHHRHHHHHHHHGDGTLKAFVNYGPSPMANKPYDGCVRMDMTGVQEVDELKRMISIDFDLDTMDRLDLFYTDRDGDLVMVLPRTTMREIRTHAVSVTAHVRAQRSAMGNTNRSALTAVGIHSVSSIGEHSHASESSGDEGMGGSSGSLGIESLLPGVDSPAQSNPSSGGSDHEDDDDDNNDDDDDNDDEDVSNGDDGEQAPTHNTADDEPHEATLGMEGAAAAGAATGTEGADADAAER